jgi:uncharacterized protein YlxW (UPF0749 family)
VTALTSRIRAIPSWQVTLGFALLALGFLIAAQLAAEGPRIRYTTQERSPLVETALALQAQQEQLKQQVLSLRGQIKALEDQSEGTTAQQRELNAALQQARVAAGLIPLTGTGIVCRLADSTQPVPANGNPADYAVTARDIRTVIAELWLAGAEAIAVNGERITATSGVLAIGGTFLVNSADLAPPFQVTAIGPTDMLDQLGTSQGWVDFIETRRGRFGIDVSFAQPPTVDIPAFAGSLNLRDARAVQPSAAP